MIAFGVLAVVNSAALAWAHFRIPSETGKVAAAAANRTELLTFVWLLALVPILQLLFWRKHNQLSQKR